MRIAVLSFILLIVTLLGFAVVFFDQWIRFPAVSRLLTRLPWPVSLSNNNPTLPEPQVPTTLPKGTQTYTFSYGDAVQGPKPQTLTINPLSPDSGQPQSITIAIRNTTPVTDVSVFTTTDTKNEVRHTLTRTGGTPTDGAWEGSWTLDDSYLSRYYIRLYIKSNKNIYNEIMKFR